MKYLGLDPGANGGIAWTGPDGAGAERMPETDAELLALLSGHRQGAVAVLEYVASSPQMGVSSAFTFGRGYGALQMALTALGIPFVLVTPKQWQGALGLWAKRPEGVTRSQHQHEKKLKQKARAARLFPTLGVTLATADALLLALYASRQDWRGIAK